MWFYQEQELKEIPDKALCFVYLITNLTNGRKYIGKKKFHFAKTKQVKGKKKKIKVESDWQDYYGSNEELKNDVVTLGTNNFRREILRICYAQAESSYYEAKYQIEFDVLLDPSQWYNGWISLKITRPHLKKLHVSA